MTHLESEINILFVAGFGPITSNPATSRRLYGEALGIAFEEASDEYYHTDQLDGVHSFGLWPLSQAAQSCFGTDAWPGDFPTPQAWVEFDVADVEKATAVLAAKGYRMLVEAREEPWGQIVSRFLSPEGMLIGITFTPWMRQESEE